MGLRDLQRHHPTVLSLCINPLRYGKNPLHYGETGFLIGGGDASIFQGIGMIRYFQYFAQDKDDFQDSFNL
jgi:hypothetical protein